MRRETGEPLDITLHGGGAQQPVKKERRPRTSAKKTTESAIIYKKTVPEKPNLGTTIMQEPEEIEFFARGDESITPEQEGEEIAQALREAPHVPKDELLPAVPEQRDTIADRERSILKKQQQRQKQKIKDEITTTERLKAARAGIREQKRQELEEKVEAIASGIQKGAEKTAVRKKRAPEEQASWVRALDEQATARARRTVETTAEIPAAKPAPPPEPQPKRKGFLGWLGGLFEKR